METYPVGLGSELSEEDTYFRKLKQYIDQYNVERAQESRSQSMKYSSRKSNKRYILPIKSSKDSVFSKIITKSLCKGCQRLQKNEKLSTDTVTKNEIRKEKVDHSFNFTTNSSEVSELRICSRCKRFDRITTGNIMNMYSLEGQEQVANTNDLNAPNKALYHSDGRKKTFVELQKEETMQRFPWKYSQKTKTISPWRKRMTELEQNREKIFLQMKKNEPDDGKGLECAYHNHLQNDYKHVRIVNPFLDTIWKKTMKVLDELHDVNVIHRDAAREHQLVRREEEIIRIEKQFKNFQFHVKAMREFLKNVRRSRRPTPSIWTLWNEVWSEEKKRQVREAFFKTHTVEELLAEAVNDIPKFEKRPPTPILYKDAETGESMKLRKGLWEEEETIYKKRENKMARILENTKKILHKELPVITANSDDEYTWANEDDFKNNPNLYNIERLESEIDGIKKAQYRAQVAAEERARFEKNKKDEKFEAHIKELFIEMKMNSIPEYKQRVKVLRDMRDRQRSSLQWLVEEEQRKEKQRKKELNALFGPEIRARLEVQHEAERKLNVEKMNHVAHDFQMLLGLTLIEYGLLR